MKRKHRKRSDRPRSRGKGGRSGHSLPRSDSDPPTFHNDDLSRRKDFLGIPFQDMAHVEEDQRIQMIGEMVIREGKTVGVLVDDIPAKVERYLRKIKERFPQIKVEYQGKGPTPGVVTIRLGLAQKETHQQN